LISASCSQSPEQKSASLVNSAKAHIQHSDYATAIIDLQNAIKAAPRNAEAYYQMGLALTARGTPENAPYYFKTAADLNPADADAQLKVAEIMIASDQKELYAEAERRAQAALKVRPKDAEVLYTLAMAEFRQGNSELAIEHLKRALEIKPGHLKSSMALAVITFEKTHNAESSEETLQKAVTQSGNSAEALIAMGRLFEFMNRSSQAEAQFRQVIGLAPDNETAYLELARLQQSLGRQADAEETLARLSSISKGPNRAAHAAFLMQAGRTEAALAELRQLAERFPGDPEVRSQLVDGYLASNHLKEAEQLLDAALSRNGSDVQSLTQRSRLYIRQERFKEAEQSIVKAMQLGLSSGAAHYILAKALNGQHRLLDSQQELRRAIAQDPSLLPARIELSQSLRLAKALAEAQRTLDGAPASQKEDPAFLAEQVWVLFARGRYNAAKPDVEKALQQGRTTVALTQAGLLELQQNHGPAGRTLLEEALRTAPDDVAPLNAIAISLAKEKGPRVAAERVRKQAALFPGSAVLQYTLGAWLEQAGDIGAARTGYEAALKADPLYAPAAVAVARMDMLAEKWDGARERVQQVLQRDARNVDALLALGMIEERTGHPDAAIAAYRKILAVDSSHVTARNNLAVLLSRNPRTADEALLIAQTLKQDVPNSPEVDDTLGWAYYRKGSYETALRYLEHAAAQSKSAVIRYHLATVYFAEGNHARGEEVLREAIALNPNSLERAEARRAAELRR
jgi:tetratricopeptide (TPR) repeat protein